MSYKQNINDKIKKIISCIMVVVLTAALLGVITPILERKSSYRKYADFFNEDKDIDVLFMGSSHIMNAVFPMELYKDYGITSYNFGGHSNQLATTYWVMENALDYKQPKVVVVDGYLLSEQIKRSTQSRFLHLSFDAFRLTPTKFRAVCDLYNDPNQSSAVEPEDAEKDEGDRVNPPLTFTELLWDYTIYHSRWNELGRNDFAPEGFADKGAELRTGFMAPGENIKISHEDTLSENTVAMDYLCKIIEECQSRNIEVLLTYMPYPDTGVGQREANTIYSIAEKYNVRYINFMEENVVDYNCDLYDEKHLNPSGARKITDYMGVYLKANYDLADRRNDDSYRDWTENYEVYRQEKLENMQEQEFFGNYLVPLADKNLDFVFELNDSSIIYKPRFAAQLKNLGIDQDKLSKNADYIYVEVAGEKVTIYDNTKNIPENISALFTNASADASEKTDNESLQVVVLDHSTGEVLDSRSFK